MVNNREGGIRLHDKLEITKVGDILFKLRTHGKACTSQWKGWEAILEIPRNKRMWHISRNFSPPRLQAGVGIEHIDSHIHEAGKSHMHPGSLMISHSHELVFVQHLFSEDKAETDILKNLLSLPASTEGRIFPFCWFKACLKKSDKMIEYFCFISVISYISHLGSLPWLE